MFAPSGQIYLCANLLFDNTYEHTIDFSSLSEQLTYITASNKHFSEYTYFRKDATIKINCALEDLWSYNYIAYQSGTSFKWIYAFITEKRYISDNVTELVIETDVFQTYLFNYTWHESFIEREHQDRWKASQLPKFNIKPENLTLGDEYIKESEQEIAASEMYFLVTASQQLETPDSYTPPLSVQEAPTPLYYYVIESKESACIVLADNPSIISIALIPFLTFNLIDCTTVSYTNPKFTSGGTINILRIMANLSTRRDFDGVDRYDGLGLPSVFAIGVTRNYLYESKLLTYPYCYNELADYQVKPLILKNEYFTEGEGEFLNNVEIELSQNISHEMKSKYFVKSGYRGETNGKETSLINNLINDLPLTTDAYKNYIQAHKASLTTGLITNAVEAALGLAAAVAIPESIPLLAGLGVVVSSATQVTATMSNLSDLQHTPENVRAMGNNISFDIQDGNCRLVLCRMAVHPDIKKSLGDYFARYGYKCSEVKIPLLRSRYYCNYIKCLGANIDGGFDTKDLLKLKDVFNSGITIWHNRTGVVPLSYQYDNVEMSLLP